MLSKENKNRKTTWSEAQFIKIKSFIEVVITLTLGAALILSVWGIRELTILFIGVDPSTIEDRTLYWVIKISEVGTIIILAIYIISDIFRHVLKAYREMRFDFAKVFYSKAKQIQGKKL